MSTLNQESRPNYRLLHIDIIRGLALLGILLVNFKAFVNPVSNGLIHPNLPSDPFNAGIEILLRTFFEGKFYIVFSLLFGASFALLFDRAASQGLNFGRIMMRRILSLAIFGVAHAILIWTGDILFLYAITGAFLFLFFRKTPVSRLPKWGLFFLIIPIFLIGMTTLVLALNPNISGQISTSATESKASERGQDLIELAASFEAQRNGSYLELVRQNWAEWTGNLAMQGMSAFFVIGLFLLGTWLLRSGRLKEVQAYRKSWKRFIVWGLSLGLPLGIWGAVLPRNLSDFDWQSAAYILCDFIGGLLLALAYMGLLTLYGSRLRILRWVAPAGRMPLTNYLSQSLVWTVICYGYGLGLAPYLQSRALHVPLALAFFVLQVQWSHWWLKRYEHGPMEYLWRWFIYFEKPALLRKASEVNRLSSGQPDSLPQ